MDDLLDFINSQNHSDDQLDQVLQTYQTYTESQSPTRQVNAHIMTEFRQPIQVQSHLEMPGILVLLGRIQRT